MSDNNTAPEIAEVNKALEAAEISEEVTPELVEGMEQIVDDLRAELKEEQAEAKSTDNSGAAKAETTEQVAEKPKRRRGRPAAATTDAEPNRGKRRESGRIDYREYVALPVLPMYRSNTTRVTNMLSDLRHKPVRVGSTIKASLIWNSKELAAIDALIEPVIDRTPMRDSPKDENYPGLDFTVFLGTDKDGNLDWMVGTRRDSVIVMREPKDGDRNVSSYTLKRMVDVYNLAIDFDDEVMDFKIDDEKRVAYSPYWIAQAEAQEKARAEREAEKEKARAAKAAEKAKAKPQAEKPKAAPKVTRRRTATKEAVASK